MVGQAVSENLRGGCWPYLITDVPRRWWYKVMVVDEMIGGTKDEKEIKERKKKVDEA
jgi:hypothetical protein